MTQAEVAAILAELKAQGSPENVAGMQHYGVDVSQAYGVRMPVLRQMAKDYKRRHDLALELWATGVHEARILASMVDDPKQVTEAQMEAWVLDFNAWDLCDQVTGNLFDKTPYAYDKVFEWGGRPEEYVKRAAFALIAWLAVHDKKAPDAKFEQFLPLIVRQATDERNFVKKAVNWALRGIGKRNLALNAKAIQTAHEIEALDSPAAKWNAKDTLRELESDKMQKRLQDKANKK